MYIYCLPSCPPPDQSAFEGGGTWFEQLECCLKPAVVYIYIYTYTYIYTCTYIVYPPSLP